MNTALITHSACLYHDTPFGHPESPDRLRAVLHALEGEEFLYLVRDEAPCVERAALERVHDGAYLDELEAMRPALGEDCRHLDPDTVMSPGTWEAALRAAGAVVAGVDGVCGGEFQNVFCAVRPPGHHAESKRAMGFCLFNNAAVAALHARAVHGLNRVAVVDFDVHHGNGTQELAYREPGLFYASIHEGRAFPMTGHAHETGMDENVINVPMASGADSTIWRSHFTRELLPPLERFKPELIIISAGFDAHRNDPLAELRLTEDDFAWATRALMDVADKTAGGRVVSTMEGGYDLTALARSAAAHVRALMAA